MWKDSLGWDSMKKRDRNTQNDVKELQRTGAWAHQAEGKAGRTRPRRGKGKFLAQASESK